MSHKIAVEVVYALPEKQYLQRVTLEEGATVEAAIRASGILELRSDIDLAKNKVGIYSRPVKLSGTCTMSVTFLRPVPSSENAMYSMPAILPSPAVTRPCASTLGP